jgi:hypothetical protein
MPSTYEIFAQFDVVEDLAIERDRQRAVFHRHWLVAAIDIDNAESGMRQANIVFSNDRGSIGPAVAQCADHSIQHVTSYGSSLKVDQSADATHIRKGQLRKRRLRQS